MAMAGLQHQQQKPWVFLDYEDDGGICEVEVDMVGRWVLRSLVL